jgi:TetR/AcrR family transcriptional regulator
MTKHQPEAKRRDQILEAARKLFVERGYVATKMSDIAELAGLSKGGVYFHFVSKEEVFSALVEDEFQRSMSIINLMGEQKEVDVSFFPQLGATFIERFQGESDTARFFIVMSEMALRDKDLRTKLQEIQKSYIEALSLLVERGTKAGFLRNVNPRATAFLWKAMMDGVEGNVALDSANEFRNLDFPAIIDVVLSGVIQK